MNISLNWLREFIDFDYSLDALSDILTMLGLEVEHIDSPGKKYDGFVVGKVLTKEKHPSADKLSVCTVFDGTQERVIICGAPNVDAGQTVAVALPGAVVPSGGFVIGNRKIRGIESSGMICSLQELDLGESHEGIWTLPDNAAAGTPLADYLELNDTVLEIGITPNRADCLSHIGVAREIAAHAGTLLAIPGVALNEADFSVEQEISVEIENSEDCPRYMARIVKNATVSESPAWLKKRLEILELRPRNVIVDIANYVMMECGQPLHSFDLDCIAGNKIVVRSASDGEKFTTLDSKERQLNSSMLMICDRDRPVAIAGVMGGENSEISDNTRNILIESAYFRPSSIRKTAKTLGISSDASYRFERGVDPEGLARALDYAASLMAKLAGGEIAQGVIDVCPRPHQKQTIVLRYSRIDSLLGVHIPKNDVHAFLQNIGCEIHRFDDESATVSAPSWRVDITEEIDLVEEVARLSHYDNIPVGSSGNFTVAETIKPEHRMPPQRKAIRQFLVSQGFSEIVTYSFVDPKTAAFFTDSPVEIANPLGDDFSVLRPSMLPSMLKTIDRNIRNGKKNLRLFDIGKSFVRDNAAGKAPIPGFVEREELCVAIAGNYTPSHWSESSRKADFYDIKGLTEAVVSDVLRSKSISLVPKEHLGVVWSANSYDVVAKGNIIGSGGEISPKFLQHFGIEEPVFAVATPMKELYSSAALPAQFAAPSLFPVAERDAAFVVDAELPADELLRAALGVHQPLLQSVEIFDVFTGENIGKNKKSVALSFRFSASDRTLTDAEINAAMEQIITSAEAGTGAYLRS